MLCAQVLCHGGMAGVSQPIDALSILAAQLLTATIDERGQAFGRREQ